MAKSSLLARILVLSALLSTAGCTFMVNDRFQRGTMTPSLYFRVDDIETPEVRVSWVHHIDTDWQARQEGQSPTQTEILFEDLPNLLTIRPELEGCSFVEVFVNGEPLDTVGEWKWASVISDGEAIIPDQDDPACSLMLTFRTMGTPPVFAITAATKNGLVEEFPDGKRNRAWLLLFPAAMIWDAVWISAVIAGILYLADPGALLDLF